MSTSRSFERLRPGEPWFGYRQFCQLFLNPLLLQARRDVPFQPWLRGSLEGMSPAECRSLLRFRDRFSRGVFAHVVLHARSEKRHADTERDVRSELERAGFGPGIVDAQLRNLESTRESVRNKRQMARTAFQNFDQKANQLFNLLSSVMKSMKEMRMGSVRNML